MIAGAGGGDLVALGLSLPGLTHPSGNVSMAKLQKGQEKS